MHRRRCRDAVSGGAVPRSGWWCGPRSVANNGVVDASRGERAKVSASTSTGKKVAHTPCMAHGLWMSMAGRAPLAVPQRPGAQCSNRNELLSAAIELERRPVEDLHGARKTVGRVSEHT